MQEQNSLTKYRMDNIKAISRTIHQISILSSDLQTLVIEQGSLLDNVKHNLETASIQVQEGVVQLDKVLCFPLFSSHFFFLGQLGSQTPRKISLFKSSHHDISHLHCLGHYYYSTTYRFSIAE